MSYWKDFHELRNEGEKVWKADDELIQVDVSSFFSVVAYLGVTLYELTILDLISSKPCTCLM